MLAIPSVHRTTQDPGKPCEARPKLDDIAGPNAVCPFSFNLFKLSKILSYEWIIGLLMFKAAFFPS